MTKRFKYRVIEVPVPQGGEPLWQIINARQNAVVSTWASQDDAHDEMQAILADEAHPNF